MMLATLGLCLLLAPQDPAAPATVLRDLAPRRVLVDEPGDGFVWARGRTYRLRIGAGCAQYAPILAAPIPPLTLRLVAARVGARELPLAAAAPVRRGDRVEIDHGPLTEVCAIPNRLQSSPHVANHGCRRFTYSYSEGTVPSELVHVAVVAGDASLTFLEGHTQVSSFAGTYAVGGIASTEERTARPGRSLATFTNGDLFAALVDGLHAGGGVTTVPTGCGRPAPRLATTGVPTPGGGVSFAITSSALGSSPFLLLGLPTATPLPLCSAGCALGMSPALVTLAGAQHAVPIPCEPALLLAQLAAQGVELNTGALSACGPPQFGITFRTTDTAIVTVR
jgi:hypothetical protein